MAKAVTTYMMQHVVVPYLEISPLWLPQNSCNALWLIHFFTNWALSSGHTVTVQPLSSSQYCVKLVSNHHGSQHFKTITCNSNSKWSMQKWKLWWTANSHTSSPVVPATVYMTRLSCSPSLLQKRVWEIVHTSRCPPRPMYIMKKICWVFAATQLHSLHDPVHWRCTSNSANIVTNQFPKKNISNIFQSRNLFHALSVSSAQSSAYGMSERWSWWPICLTAMRHAGTLILSV